MGVAMAEKAAEDPRQGLGCAQAQMTQHSPRPDAVGSTANHQDSGEMRVAPGLHPQGSPAAWMPFWAMNPFEEDSLGTMGCIREGHSRVCGEHLRSTVAGCRGEKMEMQGL